MKGKFIGNIIAVGVGLTGKEDLEPESGAIELLKQKIEKLKGLMFLIDDAVSSEIIGELQIRQNNEFVKCFPDEGESIELILV